MGALSSLGAGHGRGRPRSSPSGLTFGFSRWSGRCLPPARRRRIPAHLSLKCEPGFAEHLRSAHPAITPAYQMNKRHWNSVRLDGSLPPDLVEELLGHSYTLVVDKLPKPVRQAL